MKTYYSPSANAFFIKPLHRKIPKDAVQITNALHERLQRQQGAGKLIAPDAEGRPVAVEQEEPSTDERATLARRRRSRLLASSDFRMLPDAPGGREARSAWAAYRQALRDVPQQIGFPELLAWPESPDERSPAS